MRRLALAAAPLRSAARAASPSSAGARSSAPWGPGARTLRLALPVAVLLCASLSGCLYSNVRTPYGYLSSTPGDVKAETTDPVVTGRGCNHSVLFLIAWGNGGYAAAARNAMKDHPGAILYDVKSDIHATAVVFGLYTRQCTVVTGRVGKL